jgi:hypothetical protein
MIQFVCPACGNRLRAADSQAGKRVRCPRCKLVVEVPPPGGGPQGDLVRREPGAQGGTAAAPWWTEQRAEVPALRPGEPEAAFRTIHLIAPAWINTAFGLPMLVGCLLWFFTLLIEPREFHRFGRSFFPVFCVCFVPCLAAGVWYLLGMYRAWGHVIFWMRRANLKPSVDTAGTAVGFLFIPFFNIWWAGRFYGIARDLNRLIEEQDLDVPFAAAEHGDLLVGCLQVFALMFFLSLCLPFLMIFGLLCALLGQVALLLFAHHLHRSVNAVGRLLGGVPA